METLRTPRTRNQESFLRRLDQASRQMMPGPPRPLTFADVRNANIDVAAQQALVAMSQSPALRTVATGLAQAVQGGRLGGIYRQDQRVPALRAQQLGSTWWQMIPAAQDFILLLHPQQPLAAPPVVVVRNQAADVRERLTRALAQVWGGFQLWQQGQLTSCGSGGGRRLAFIVPAVCMAPPSHPPIDLLAYASGYVNPHLGNEATEVRALAQGTWEPSNPDFQAIADASGFPLRFATDGLWTLLNVLNGQQPGSVRNLGLVGHSSALTFSLSGGIVDGAVSFNKDRAISRRNLASQVAQDFITRNQLWNRFASGGQIILYGCRSGSRTSTPDIPAELLVALSRAFRVCARGFRHKICTFLGHRGNQITQRGLLRYDPQGRACASFARPPFQTLGRLVPDGPPACQGITSVDIRPAREARASLRSA
jgi:hypothetical protein